MPRESDVLGHRYKSRCPDFCVFWRMSNIKLSDLRNQQFGKLTVIKRGPDHLLPSGKRQVQWYCKCSCGNPKDILVNGQHLRSGHTKSCGCSVVDRCKQNKYVIDRDHKIAIGLIGEGEDRFYIDLEDLYLVQPYSWHRSLQGYICAYGRNGNTIRLHRLICQVIEEKDKEVDHINHDVSDNRKCNLRIVTGKENQWNLGLHKNNSSGVTGVSWDAERNKWRATIDSDGIRHRIGRFDSFEDAVAARKAAEEKYFGEYSYDNSMAAVPRIVI